MKLIVPTAFGTESVTARELMDLGYTDQVKENGKVMFEGDELAIARTNLWLRTGARVEILMGMFEARTFEELFQQTKALPWDEWLPENAAFPVTGKSVQSTLFSVSDCQAIVKKAIVEKLKTKYHREIFEETGPTYKIEVALLKDIVTITLDTSGPGLHKRGYRRLTGAAPMKETMASALLLLSYWKGGRVLYDPFCGSGTIPIEAAFIALNKAPGMHRRFLAETWGNFDPSIWKQARQEAKDLMRPAYDLQISGSDIDPKAVELAMHSAKEAHLENMIRFSVGDMRHFTSREQYGFIVTNPPYGERLGEQAETEQLYRDMGKTFRKLDTWSFYIISGHQEFERYFGKRADKRRKFYSGKLMCQYYQYFGPKPPRKPKDE